LKIQILINLSGKGAKRIFLEKAREAAGIYQQEAERQIASEATARAKREAKLEQERKRAQPV
jgi:hypothetical protein